MENISPACKHVGSIAASQGCRMVPGKGAACPPGSSPIVSAKGTERSLGSTLALPEGP